MRADEGAAERQTKRDVRDLEKEKKGREGNP